MYPSQASGLSVISLAIREVIIVCLAQFAKGNFQYMVHFY